MDNPFLAIISSINSSSPSLRGSMDKYRTLFRRLLDKSRLFSAFFIRRFRFINILILLCWFISLYLLIPIPQCHALEMENNVIRVGILAKRGNKQCISKWQDTISYLNKTVPDRHFILDCLDFRTLPKKVARGELDFILSNPSMYVQLEYTSGISRIATLKNKAHHKAYTRFGGVIFTRADRNDINGIQDLQGQRFMAVDRQSFGGWLVSKQHLVKQELNPEKDFQALLFGNTHDNVVYAVVQKKVDAGAVRTDTLERMAREGKIDLRQIKILDKQPEGDTDFPFLRSTRLYPEWPFAKARQTNEQLARQVVIALLAMNPDTRAAQSAHCMGWTIPLDYSPVHECLKELRLPPYNQAEKISFQQLITQYRPWIMAASTLILVLSGAASHVFILNRRLRRTMKKLDHELMERKKILVDLNEFKQALNQINDCVFMFAPDTLQFQYANRGAMLQIGYSYGELFAMTPVDIKPEFTEQQFRKLIEPLRHNPDDSLTFTTIHRRKDGSTLPVEIFLQYVEQGSGQDTFVAIVHDISSRLAEEKEKEQLQTRLLHTQKLESVGQLAAGIAHEINTPVQYVGTNIDFLDEAFTDLTALINQFLSLLAKARQADIDTTIVDAVQETLDEIDWEYLAEEIPEAVKQSKDGIHRVTSIVLAMKEFSHPGSREKAAADMNRLIATTITVARNEWKYVAEVETDFAEDLPQVPCLTDEMGQVILNLLINAAHSIEEKLGENPDGKKEKIVLTTRHIDTMVEITIRDNGMGIPPEIRKKIFDPFFTTKEVGKGTGQGLAIARDVIVNKHGGSIEALSSEGEGTTFILRLPIAEGTQQ